MFVPFSGCAHMHHSHVITVVVARLLVLLHIFVMCELEKNVNV